MSDAKQNQRRQSAAGASIQLLVLASLASQVQLAQGERVLGGQLARGHSLVPPKQLAWLAEGSARQVRVKRQVSKPPVASELSKDKKKGKKKPKGDRFELDCLNAHNKWRRQHGAPDLVVDKKITKFAQKRADHIAKSDGDEFKHPPDLPYGENLAWHSLSTKKCHDLVKMWYDEIELYDFNKPKFDHETGHFTQLVWRDTRKVGCARAISSGKRGGIYLVCNYDPPGNFLGEESANVLPKSTSPGAFVSTSSSVSTVTQPTTALSVASTTQARASTVPSGSEVGSTRGSVTSTARSTDRSDVGEKEAEEEKYKENKKKKKKDKKKNKKKSKSKKKRSGNKKANKKSKLTTTTSSTTRKPEEAESTVSST